MNERGKQHLRDIKELEKRRNGSERSASFNRGSLDSIALSLVAHSFIRSISFIFLTLASSPSPCALAPYTFCNNKCPLLFRSLVSESRL